MSLVVLLSLVVLGCGAARTAGTGVPSNLAPAGATPSGLRIANVAARGVLTYDAVLVADTLVSVELAERFELVVRDISGAELARIDLGPPDYDMTDLAVDSVEAEAWISSADGQVRAFSLKSGEEIANIHLGARATAVALSARYIATGSATGVLCLRRRDDLALLQCIAAQDAPLSALDFSRDGTSLVSAWWNGQATLWTVPSLAVRANAKLGGSVNDVRVAPAGDSIAAATSAVPPIRTPEIARRERTMRSRPEAGAELVIWKFNTSPRRCRGHRAAVTSLAWVDDQHLISGSWDRTVRLWRRRDCLQLAQIAGFAGLVHGLSTSRQGLPRVAIAAWSAAADSRATVVLDLLYSQ